MIYIFISYLDFSELFVLEKLKHKHHIPITESQQALTHDPSCFILYYLLIGGKNTLKQFKTLRGNIAYFTLTNHKEISRRSRMVIQSIACLIISEQGVLQSALGTLTLGVLWQL